MKKKIGAAGLLGLGVGMCLSLVWIVIADRPRVPVEEIGPRVTPEASISFSGGQSVSQEEWAMVYDCLWNLHQEDRLTASWTAPSAAAGPQSALYTDFSLESLYVDSDGVYTAQAILRGTVCVDPETQMDTADEAGIWITREMVPTGRAEVALERGPDGGVEAVSCSYLPVENPGHQYLSQVTRNTRGKLEESPRIGVGSYDPRLVEYLYRQVQSRRLIGGPEELTEYDLAAFVDTLELTPWDFENMGVEMGEEPLESSLLALVTGAEGVAIHHPLTDYGVFASMERVGTFTINDATQDMMDALRIGHTDILNLIDPQFEILDTSRLGVSTVMMHSWSTGITGFRGCGNIDALIMQTTKMDTALLTRDNLPGVTRLQLEYYHDYNKPHDFSGLATFPEDVEIYMELNYLACQPETLASLKGVRLGSLTLRPQDGPAAQAFDYGLLGDITARMILVEAGGA